MYMYICIYKYVYICIYINRNDHVMSGLGLGRVQSWGLELRL